MPESNSKRTTNILLFALLYKTREKYKAMQIYMTKLILGSSIKKLERILQYLHELIDFIYLLFIKIFF